METAAARCLALTEIVELVFDHVCASSWASQTEENLLAFRRVNRLWQDIAEKRLTSSIRLYAGQFRSRCRRFNLSALFARRPHCLQNVKEVEVVTRADDMAAHLSPLQSLHNLTSISLGNDLLLESLAACFSDAPAQLQQVVRFSITVFSGNDNPTQRAGRFLKSLPSLRILELEGVVGSAAQTGAAIQECHCVDIIEGCQPRIESLSITLLFFVGGSVMEYLSNFLNPFTKLQSLSITLSKDMEVPGLLAAMPNHVEHFTHKAGNNQIRLLLMDLADAFLAPNLKRVPTLSDDTNEGCECPECIEPALDITKDIVQAALEGLRKRGGVQDLEREGPRLFRFVCSEGPGNSEDPFAE